MKVNKTRQL